MALTWTQLQTKAQRLSRDTTPATLEQLKQDMNTGYHLFNNKLARYWSRKQQFTNLIAGQGIYQTPVDSIRVEVIVIAVSNTYQIPVKEIRSEFEWRQITAYPYSSNWPAYYFVIGNDEVALWPTPSQNVTNGLRFVYQQDDFDLSVEDVVSTEQSPVVTATFTNGSPTVTASSAIFTPQMKGLYIQNTAVTNLTWYEIVDVPDSTHVTLKSAFVGISGSGLSFTVGQLPIIPSPYHDAIINYALYQFYSGKGSDARANQHLNLFEASVTDAVQQYSSSTQGNVLTNDDNYVNAWFLTPLPPPGV